MFGIEFIGAKEGSKWDRQDWNWQYANSTAVQKYAIDVIDLMEKDPDAPREAMLTGFRSGGKPLKFSDLKTELHFLR